MDIPWGKPASAYDKAFLSKYSLCFAGAFLCFKGEYLPKENNKAGKNIHNMQSIADSLGS
jgi:hypothetical protein